MVNLLDIEFWKKHYGLLPIHLFPQSVGDDFIMLNGGNGDFCLKLDNNEFPIEDYYSNSWSSNTKNFIAIGNDQVSIYNWIKRKPENISIKTVVENLDKFYEYIYKNSIRSDVDVVPFIITIFRQLRNLTRERVNPVEALNLLYILLASIEESTDDFEFKKWGISQTIIPSGFEQYSNILKEGSQSIKPKIELILRHAAGALFQEAQKEVLFFNSQIDIFGRISDKLETRILSYSSIHYTPSYLARTIVENTILQFDLSKSTIKIFDPACGSGEFLIEVLKQLREKQYLGSVKLIGWDCSETAVNTTNFLLTYEKRIFWKNRIDVDIKIVKDSLLEKWDDDYDIILMNPPFISWEQLLKEEREAVRNTLNSFLVGKPNQASAFFYKAIKHLSDNGLIGCVIPSSLLVLDSYSKLREEISEILSISLIGALGNFVFEDALTDISIILAKKSNEKKIPNILWTKNEKGIPQIALRDYRKSLYSNKFELDKKYYSYYQPIAFPIVKNSWKPVSLQENELLKKLETFIQTKRLVPLSDVFNVQQGIRTGDNAIFKISRTTFDLLPPQEKLYFKPSIDNESIKDCIIFENSYVWYPYDSQGIIIHDEYELISKVPTFYNDVLKNAKERLAKRARKDDSTWWHLSEHRAWLRTKEHRLVSTEFGKSNSFAFDKEGKYVIERGNAYLPKKTFETIDTYYFYLALFSSNLFDTLLSIYSKQLLSGWDLGKKYTKDIPIPDANETTVMSSIGYMKLIDIGRSLSEGRLHIKPLIDDILLTHFYPSEKS